MGEQLCEICLIQTHTLRCETTYLSRKKQDPINKTTLNLEEEEEEEDEEVPSNSKAFW